MNNNIRKLDFKKLANKTIFNQAISDFNNKGVLIIKNVLTDKDCNSLIKTLETVHSKTSKIQKKNDKSFSGHFSAKYVSNLHNKNPKFLDFMDYSYIHSLILKLLQQGSYQNSGKIILQANEARSPISKAPAQQLHNDARIVGSKYPLVIQAMWALEDFKENNGPTRFVLGSHKILKFPINNKKYNNETIATARKGSVIIFNGSVWHGSSQVTSSNTSRWAMIFRYSRWYLRPSYDFKKNTPLNIYKKMNTTQKQLLGFDINIPKDEFMFKKNNNEKFVKPYKYKLPF